MASEKACYWLALAVLIMGLSGKFANRTGDWARGVFQAPLQRAGLMADRVANHLETTAMRLDRHSQTASVLVQVKAAQTQAKVACVNAALDRRAAVRLSVAMARLNAKMARLQARQAWQ
jgi:hypothetical protein